MWYNSNSSTRSELPYDIYKDMTKYWKNTKIRQTNVVFFVYFYYTTHTHTLVSCSYIYIYIYILYILYILYIIYYIYIYIYIFHKWIEHIHNIIYMVFSTEGFFEVAIGSWLEWDLNQWPLNSVQML